MPGSANDALTPDNTSALATLGFILEHCSEHFDNEDIVYLTRTCKTLYKLTPKIILYKEMYAHNIPAVAWIIKSEFTFNCVIFCEYTARCDKHVKNALTFKYISGSGPIPQKNKKNNENDNQNLWKRTKKFLGS